MATQELVSSQGFAVESWQTQEDINEHNARLDRAMQGVSDPNVLQYMKESRITSGEGWRMEAVKQDEQAARWFLHNRATQARYRMVPALITSYPSGQLHSYTVQEQAVN